ncbi:MAG: lysophospholipid acyltransferase family protein [Nitrospiraceae bacterium]|nr:lysophospholipid acyltransferase family protein [Nitrospiraceae bacterium]
MKPWLTRARKRLSRVTIVVLVRCFQTLARIFPYRAAVACGSAFGWLTYHLLPRERGRALQHLTAVFPGRGASWAKRTGVRTFMHLGRGLMEVLAMTPSRIGKVVRIEGLERLEEALSLGKGVVYVTGHIGNWELMAGAVASRKMPVSVIAAPIKPESVNDLILELRAGLGVKTIVRSRPGAAKEMIRVFRENRIIGILIDQDTDVDGAFVDFLGKPAWTPTAAAQMAAKFGAPVMFGYITRNSNGTHTVKIEGPLHLVQTGADAKDITDNTAMLTKKIEEAVLREPEQWVWMHRRWRRQP